MKTKILVILLSVLVIACGKKDKKAQLESLKKQHDEIAAQIKTLEQQLSIEDTTNTVVKSKTIAFSELVPQPFKHYVEVQGKVDGEDNVTVTSQTIGVITQINVKEGDEVTKGQVLAQLDASVMESGLKEIESQMPFLDSLYQKQKRLWDRKIGSEIQYLTAKNNKESLEKKKKTLLEQIDMSKITAPISGTIEEVGAKLGQSMAPGIPAFRVVNFSKIKIMAEVSEAYSSKIKKGDDVLVSFPDLGKELPAKIDFASKYISPVNRTFQIEVRMDGQQVEFRANMIAGIKINDYKVDSALVVPINFVQKSLNGEFVFVAKEENGQKLAVKKTVVVGSSYNGLAEIKSGLQRKDKIITVGYQDLNEGQAINY